MKILSQEVNLGIGTTNVSKSTVVRIYNSSSDVGIVTTKNSSDSVIGSLTIPGSQVLYAQKNATDTLTGSSTIKVAKTAYSSVMQYASWSSGGGGSGYTDGDIVTSNLTYHLDANNSSSYEDGDGDTWTDLVAGTNNATINGPTYTEGTGNQGYYFAFDGTDDYVEFDQNAFDLGSTFTIEIWSRHNSASESTQGVPYLGSSSNHQGVVFSTNKSWVGTSNAGSPLLNFGKENVLYQSSGGSSYTITLTDLPLQTWRQVVLTKASGTSGTNLNLYLNGSLVGTPQFFSYSVDDYVTNDSNPSILGANATNALQGWWDGQVSIFRVYSTPLSATQVETNYDANKGRYGLS